MPRSRPSYATKARNPDESVRCRGTSIRVHFKNTRETAMAIKGKSLHKAQLFLHDVIAHKAAVPFRRFTGGIGRTPQVQQAGVSHGRWPKKSCEVLLRLLDNAKANAEVKQLPLEDLHITHIAVNPAPKQRRRTYRAHGRIGPYMCSPCHVEMILSQTKNAVKKPPQRRKRR